MKRQSSSQNLDGQHPSHRSNPSFYQLVQHNREAENVEAPIRENMVKFKDSSLQEIYLQYLYCSQDSIKKLSKEYSQNLLIFFVYYLGVLLVITFAEISFYLNELHSEAMFIFVVILLGLLLFVCIWVIIYLKLRILKAQTIFTIMISITIFIWIFMDGRVLFKLFGKEYQPNHVSTDILIISLIFISRKVLFDSFHHTLIITLITGFSYIVVNATLSSFDWFSVTANFFQLSFTLMVNIIDIHGINHRSLQLFWEIWNETKDKTEKPVFMQENQDFKTNLELMVETCRDMRFSLKSLRKVIFSNEVRKQIQNIMTQLLNLGRRIISIEQNQNIIVNPELTEEDLLFIDQQYINNRPLLRSQTGDAIAHPSVKIDIFDKYQEVKETIKAIGQIWNFDILFISQVTGQNIAIIGTYLMQYWNLDQVFNIPQDCIQNFFWNLEQQYLNNPYHNANHAADVAHAMQYFIVNSFLIKHMQSIDILSTVIASLAHDVGHPGLNNRFLVNSKDDIALMWNDQSVLENMHCYRTFKIMQDQLNCNILATLGNDDWFLCRKFILELILATDLTKHFNLLGVFRTRAIQLNEIDITRKEDLLFCLSIGLKCADINHSAKPLDLHQKWTNYVVEEFFNQGDLEKEKGLPVSMYCDRVTTNIAKSQAGFLRNICIPLLDNWSKWLDSSKIDEAVYQQIIKNVEHWENHSNARKIGSVMNIGNFIPPKFSKQNHIKSLGLSYSKG